MDIWRSTENSQNWQKHFVPDGNWSSFLSDFFQISITPYTGISKLKVLRVSSLRVEYCTFLNMPTQRSVQAICL